MNRSNRIWAPLSALVLTTLITIAVSVAYQGDTAQSSEAPVTSPASSIEPAVRFEPVASPQSRVGTTTVVEGEQRLGSTTTAAPQAVTTPPAPDTTGATLPPVTTAPTPPPLALPALAPSTPATTAPPPPPPPPRPSADEQSRAVAVSLELLNQERAAVGLGPLQLDGSMNEYARNWSATMASSGFRHSSGPYGENIAWHSDDGMSAESAATYFNGAWRDSSGHYANMTEARYTHVGIGFHHDGSGWWATHVFR